MERLVVVEQEFGNLTETAARGGAVSYVLEALAKRDAERQALLAKLEALNRQSGASRPEVSRYVPS
jgi:hypothetical protein